MRRVAAAVVLAAGASSRMGSPKALLRLADRPVVHWHALRLGAVAERTVVVLGASAEAIRAVLPAGVETVVNPRWATTAPADSLALALNVLDLAGEILVTPVDVLPAEPDTLAALLSGPAPAVPVDADGVAGHPVRLDAATVAAIRRRAPDGGLRTLLAGARLIPVADPQVTSDFDDPEAWAELSARWAGLVTGDRTAYGRRMSTPHRVAVLVGSLRRESWSRKLATALFELVPDLSFELVEIGALPLYDDDDEAHPSAATTAFREQVRGADAVLFVTPEYNRSVPGVLKNAIDVGSRPYGKSAWAGKPGAVISCSPGALGAFGANHHLRQSLVFLDVPVLQQPEAYIGNVATLFGPDGRLANDATRELLRKFGAAFGRWIDLNLAARG